MRKIILKIMVKEMNDLYKQREVSEETMALVEAVLERLEFHAFEEVLIWSEENASKALRRCLKNTLNEFKSGKLILTSSYPKLKHYSVDSVVNGLQTALTQAQEHQDNLNEQIDALKAQLSKYENKRFFSHDFNGDGFQYHDTLEEAKKEAEAGLDWYRDRVAGGHHVEDDGEFKELCFGIVLASADYNVDEVVTKEHHMNDEWTKYEVGTEILSLDFYEEPVKPSQENSHD